MALFVRNGVGGSPAAVGHDQGGVNNRFRRLRLNIGTLWFLARSVSWITCVLGILIVASTSPEQARAASAREGPRAVDLSFDPARPETGGELKLKLKLVDAVRAEVRWFVNGEEVEVSYYDGLSGNVPFEKPLKAGQTIKASVTPFNDSGAKGETVDKSVTCGGAPPTLKLVRQGMEGNTYTAKIEAKDPQEGKLNLSLEGPDGMKIDQSGNITWLRKKDETGQFHVKVTAKDEKGAEAVLTYTVTIRKGNR